MEEPGQTLLNKGSHICAVQVIILSAHPRWTSSVMSQVWGAG
jgi:hypothetical protein